jgi:hypothetical protein
MRWFVSLIVKSVSFEIRKVTIAGFFPKESRAHLNKGCLSLY